MERKHFACQNLLYDFLACVVNFFVDEGNITTVIGVACKGNPNLFLSSNSRS